MIPDHPDPATRQMAFKWEWNVNTVVVICGFIAGFIGWGYTMSDFRHGQQQNTDAIALVAKQAADIAARMEVMERAQLKYDNQEYRLAQMEKGMEGVDVRISRITESYSNQFADFRTQLSAISTQIALTNQTLQRMEVTREVPRPPR